MKRILMICCMLVASATLSNAQQTAPAPDVAAPVSKTEFTQKVRDLDNLIQQDNKADANKKFDEISQMINAELKVMRYKIRDTKNESEQKQYMDATIKQRTLYGQIMQQRGDLSANRKTVIEKLNEFAATIL